jgi:hypothetical protein
MHRFTRQRLAALVVAGAILGSIGLRADEGFWPFNALPKAALERTHGFTVSDEWLTHLQLASVRFGGASGSFVSPDGLVLTNHHVGLGAISKLSTAERDLVKHGFYARTRAEELKAVDTELNVLVSIEDVTAKVDDAVKSGMSASEAFAARRAAIAALEQESTATTGLRSDVVTLYQGGMYHLYRYKRYTDVRLVFAPEFDIAFFGGDPDNFTYPRFNLDVALFRAYEDGKPARTEHYLKWAEKGAAEGELVFTSGHPGATQRLNTVAHLEYLRDTGLPLSLTSLERRRQALVRYGERGAEEARQVKDEIFGLENSLKSRRGQLAGLQDPAVMAQKRAAEARLRQAVTSDEAMKARFGDPWQEVAAARQGLPAYAREYELLEGMGAFGSRLFSLARTIVRLVEEDAKPDAGRLAEFTAARRASLERMLYSPAPLYTGADLARMTDALENLESTLGPDHPAVKATLGGKRPAARAEELVTGTTLTDVAARKALVASGPAGVAASADPMIVLARAVDPMARQLRTRMEAEVAGVEREAYAKIARALFAVEGTNAYPDGTSTLRLSAGVIKGYEEEGRAVRPFTTLGGLYEHARAHGEKTPWALPQRWFDRKGALDPAIPFNFVSTNDIVGGNSGSPVVNRRGEIVGIAFDGNIHSLPGYFVYDGTRNRSVSVDTRGILEALVKVYEAAPLVDELLGRVPAGVTPETAAR